MVESEHLFRNINDGILEERFAAFERNLEKNLPLIRTHGGLRGVVSELDGAVAVVVGAGPTLDRDLAVLARLADRVKIIAADMAFAALAARGISPHFVISCETRPFDFICGRETRGMRLLAFSCMSHANLTRWRGPVHFYNWMIGGAYERLWDRAGRDLGAVATGGLVTTQAVSFALGCPIRALVLVGNDLAFTDRYYARSVAETRGHARAVCRRSPLETIETEMVRRAMDFKILRGTRAYLTTRQFLAAKIWLERLFANHRHRVYDCGDPGCSEKYVAKTDLENIMNSLCGTLEGRTAL